jgi:predicted site-specific integrase-resolvase
MPEILTTSQLAGRLQVTPQTIRRWCQKGLIQPLRRITVRPILFDWEQVRAALEPSRQKDKN